MSLRVSRSGAAPACSGLMYCGVPTIIPSSVSCRLCPASPAAPASALATPKSITLGTARPSTSATRMLDGLRSRWRIAFWWAWCTAWQTGTNSPSRSRSPSRWRSQ